MTVERSDGKYIWGIMGLESTGMELMYRNSIHDSKHLESSYVIYGSEYADIRAIYRYADELTGDNKDRREADLRTWFHPGPRRRIARSTQHFVATAAESLNEVVSLIVGRLRKPAGRYITEQGETHLRSLGDTMIGQVGHAHDPLLERYVGQKVVFELVEQGDEVHEHVGLFKNYSPDFLEILDVHFPQRLVVDLGQSGESASARVHARFTDDTLAITCKAKAPLLVESIEQDGEEQMLNVVVKPQETVELAMAPAQRSAHLHVRIVRELDMIVPRTCCVLRHRVERFQPELVPEIIFDLGVVVQGQPRLLAKEMRLRKQLEETPDSALLAANLGAVLMQRQSYAEAEQFLCQALEVRYSLPDNGQRAEILLADLRRQKAKAPHPVDAVVAERVTQEVHQAEARLTEFNDLGTSRAEADRAVSVRHW